MLKRSLRCLSWLSVRALIGVLIPQLSWGAYSVTIRVVDANGTGVEGAQIYAVNYGEKGPSSSSVFDDVETDENGEAVLSGLDSEKEFDVMADKLYVERNRYAVAARG